MLVEMEFIDGHVHYWDLDHDSGIHSMDRVGMVCKQFSPHDYVTTFNGCGMDDSLTLNSVIHVEVMMGGGEGRDALIIDDSTKANPIASPIDEVKWLNSFTDHSVPITGIVA